MLFKISVFLGSLVFLNIMSTSNLKARWVGVDETVVEKFAKEHGRQSRTPLINTDQGDLLLFLFLLAGTIAGFSAGYYWKMLMDQKEQGKGL